MPKYAMVIDLQKCVGCGACAIACKTENNTQNRTNGQTFNWADYLIESKGKFPNVRYENKPVLCNHCSNAACVEVCPVTPKAMFKSDDNITMHNAERCIGCRLCQQACPYSAYDVKKENAQYSVISFNDFCEQPHPAYKDTSVMIANCTSSGKEVSEKVGDIPPNRHRYRVNDCMDVRKDGIVEKCLFCSHRVHNGDDPYCVESCPSQARVFGDINNPDSEASKLLKKYDPSVLKPEAGTKPNVYYIRQFRQRG